jgi:hypothetical protein
MSGAEKKPYTNTKHTEQVDEGKCERRWAFCACAEYGKPFADTNGFGEKLQWQPERDEIEKGRKNAMAK